MFKEDWETFKMWIKEEWYEHPITIIAVSFLTVCIISLITIFIVSFLGFDEKQKEKDLVVYNQGVHDVCGGNWIYKDKQDWWYIYECDKCDATFRAHEYLTKEEALKAAEIKRKMED